MSLSDIIKLLLVVIFFLFWNVWSCDGFVYFLEIYEIHFPRYLFYRIKLKAKNTHTVPVTRKYMASHLSVLVHASHYSVLVHGLSLVCLGTWPLTCLSWYMLLTTLSWYMASHLSVLVQALQYKVSGLN